MTYLKHYHLSDHPFQDETDMRYLWLEGSLSKTASKLKEGLLQDAGLVILSGDAGCGKTMLVKRIAEVFKDRAFIVQIPDPALECPEFFNFLSKRLDIGPQFKSKSAFLIHFRKFLRQMYDDDKKVLLIVDNAHQINVALLKELALLAEIEMNGQKMITVLLSGQKKLRAILNGENLGDVRKHVTSMIELGHLFEDETSRYIDHRLKLAGATKKIFNAKALKEIFKYSEGNPHIINTLCEQALKTGYAKKKRTLDAPFIKNCIREFSAQKTPGLNNELSENLILQRSLAKRLQRNRQGPSRSRFGFIAAVILAGCLAIVGVYGLNKNDKPLWDIEEIAPQQVDFLTPQEKNVTSSNQVDKKEEQDAADQTLDGRISDSTNSTAGSGMEKKNKMAAATQPDEKINNSGTAKADIAPQKIIVHFHHDSNEISADAIAALDNLAGYMIRHPQKRLIIKGYTDSKGALSYNVTLSKYRADSVKSYLAAKGVSPANMQSLGMGPKNPLHSNKTAAGRKLNRRVEVELTEGK